MYKKGKPIDRSKYIRDLLADVRVAENKEKQTNKKEE